MKREPADTAACVRAVIRQDVQDTHAYVVSDARGFVKLDAMENPYPLPEHLRKALEQRLGEVQLNRYPAPDSPALAAALRQATPVPEAASLMFGNGSDELIHLVIQACCAPGDVVMSPVPTFVMYAVSARWNHAHFVGVPIRTDFTLDMPALREAIQTHRPKVLFVAYPNNPTGRACRLDDLQELADLVSPGLLVVDEAYAPFASASYMSHVLDRPNTIVIRTLSKQGLAGIRLGYLAGHPAWVSEFDKVRPPYNINVLTRAAAELLLAHHSVLDDQARDLVAQRAVLTAALREVPGVLQVYDSQANFLLFRVADPGRTFQGLRDAGILIKNVSGAHERLAGCLRVTVSTEAENTQFIQAMKKVMAS